MFISALFPPGTPSWVRWAVEAGTLLLAARILLHVVKRLSLGVLALAAAAWVWFFYPPGHLWMATEAVRLLAWAKGGLPTVVRGVEAGASRAAASAARSGSSSSTG